MQALSPFALPALSVGMGATTPVPASGVGALCWSSLAALPLVWTGSAWASLAYGIWHSSTVDDDVDYPIFDF